MIGKPSAWTPRNNFSQHQNESAAFTGCAFFFVPIELDVKLALIPQVRCGKNAAKFCLLPSR